MSIRDQVLPRAAVPLVKDGHTFQKAGENTWRCIDCAADVVAANDGEVWLVTGDATQVSCKLARALDDVADIGQHLDGFFLGVSAETVGIMHRHCDWQAEADSLGALVRLAEAHLLVGCE